LLGAIYLFRTIILFNDERAAILGSLIYLFFPVTFLYAGLAEVGCGTVFFIILISFHFLRFIKNRDYRDIILTSFFIGAGFLYKRPVFLMVFICAAYLMYDRVKNKNRDLSISLKVLSLSLIPIIPWMIIGKFYTWRNYKIVWSNFIPPDGKVYAYIMQIPSDISWVLFALFILSTIFILAFKRNNLTLFFLSLFIIYYFFYAIDMAAISPRLSMVLYPTIAAFTALFVSEIINKIRWKHFFKSIFIAFFAYLIAICTIPPFNSRYLKSVEFKKLQYYPIEEAMQWVKENVKDGEKILTLRIMPALFYRDKYKIEKNKIVHYWYELKDVSTPEKLRKFVYENRITYILFPYSPEYPYSQHVPILQYLKENNENEFLETSRFQRDNYTLHLYRTL
jgi:4-amino-4-deoxy-L-arabinose transferase-like glycosyltransferase